MELNQEQQRSKFKAVFMSTVGQLIKELKLNPPLPAEGSQFIFVGSF